MWKLNQQIDKRIGNVILIIIGTTLLGISIDVFFDELGLIIGGVTGLAIIIKKLTEGFIDGGMPIYWTNLIINVPLFIGAIKIKGKHFGGKSLFATLYLSLVLYFTQYIPPLTQDILLGTIFGSVLSGVGLGLVFSGMATTGGTDLAASIVQHFWRFLSIQKIMMALDAVIIMGGFFVFGPENTMYALIAVYISTKVIDAILEGLKFAKAAWIITEKDEEVAARLIKELDRGLTGLHGEGMYTRHSKNVLLCVVSQRQMVELKEIVRSVDPKAFVIVADVREVVGEGFTH